MFTHLSMSKFAWLLVCLTTLGCRHEAVPDGASASPRPSSEPGPVWRTLAPGLQACPLPERPVWAGTRFESLAVERTGVDFAHNWTPPPEYKLEIYNSLPGGGVCIGDYDADGWPDVFLTQPYVGSRLYRNQGDFRFEDVTSATVGDSPYGQGATFVDIDNDGDLDLYVCNDNLPNQLFLNNGRGGFQERAAEFGLDFSGASVMMAFADFDRDGDLDAYLVTNRREVDDAVEPPRPRRRDDGAFEIDEQDRELIDVIVSADDQPRVVKAAQYDHLYRNNGDGTFSDVSRAAGIDGNYWGLAATCWDYDRDGWPDIYVSNDFYSPDQLYHNNGDGTFTDVAPAALPHTPWYSMGNDAADINNDGWLDFMASDMSGTNHYKQKASMGDMSNTAWFLTHPTPRQYMRNALYLNTGAARFLEVAQLAGVANTDWTWSLKFADLDEDGWNDLFVTNGMNRDWTNSDLRNQSNQVASAEEKMRIWLASPQRRDANLALRNTGDLRFNPVGREWGLEAEKVSYGAAMADLDRDGDLDLIVNNAEEAAAVYRNQTADSHRVLVRLKGVRSNRWGIGATVWIETETPSVAAGQPPRTMRQTRHLANSQGYMSSNEPLLHFGLGQAQRVRRLEVHWPSGNRQTFEDLPADQFYLVEETAAAPESTATSDPVTPPSRPLLQRLSACETAVHRETPFNDFVRQPLLPNQLSQLGPGTACGDVDGDGDADVFLGGASGEAGKLLLNQDGQLVDEKAGPWQADAACEDMGVLLLDVEGDGDLDLYVVSGGVECEPRDPILQDRLYLNDGLGEFTHAPDDALPVMHESGSVAAAADFDRDGDLDLFVGGRVIPGEYPLTPRSYLLRNDQGRFADVTTEVADALEATGLVTSALWSDVDGDGWTDLLVTHEWGPVKLYRNDHGRLVDGTAAAGLAGRLGWYNSITGGDLDGDGDIDFVVGNFGWNTKYHASDDKPALLYYGDFEQTGRMRLIEAEYEDDTLFPVRGKSCSTNAMPFLGDKFEKFHDFAVASLQDIYTPTRLNSSHRYAANSLETGVLMNDGAGRFDFHALPTLAQASATFGIVVGCFTDDAQPDIVLAQNFYGPQAETGRVDGGVSLLLAGNGDGTFTPLSPRDSGLVVPGDATSACLADVNQDGRADLLVATNDGPLYVFGSAPDAPAPLVIRLRGSGANSAAVGARVTVTFSDDSTWTAEISCGGGYLSQSTSDLFCPLLPGLRVVQVDVVWPDGSIRSVTPTSTSAPVIVRQAE